MREGHVTPPCQLLPCYASMQQQQQKGNAKAKMQQSIGRQRNTNKARTEEGEDEEGTHAIYKRTRIEKRIRKTKRREAHMGGRHKARHRQWEGNKGMVAGKVGA